MKVEFFELSSAARFVGAASEFLWQGALIVLIVVLLDILFGRRSPRIAYGVNLLGMILLAVCLPINWLAHEESAVRGGEPVVNRAVSGNPLAESETARMEALAVRSMPMQAAPEELFGSVSIKSVLEAHASALTIGYLVGVALLLVRLLAAVHGGRRLKRSARPITDPEMSTLAARISKTLQLKMVPAISYCGQVTCPAIVGVVKPVILIPLSIATQLSLTQLEAVLAHELAHLRRNDHIVLLFQRFAEALLFFHPAVWLLSRRLERTRELCCDDLVLSSGADASDYADALLRFSELAHGESARSADAVAALALDGGRSSQLSGRIMRILGIRKMSSIRLNGSGIVSLLLVVSFVALLPLGPFQAKARNPGEPGLDTATEDEGEPVSHIHRVIFRPNPETKKRTSWSQLHRSKIFSEEGKVVYFLQAQMTPQGWFPVIMEGEEKERFRVTMLEGDDEQLELQLAYDIDPSRIAGATADGVLRVDARAEVDILVKRDERKEIEVNGITYLIHYPITHVGRDDSNVSETVPVFVFKTEIEYRAKRFVITKDKRLVFEGRATTWEALPELLDSVPDRSEIVLELGVESFDHVLVSELHKYQSRLGQLARKMEFKYGSFVGEQPVVLGDPDSSRKK